MKIDFSSFTFPEINPNNEFEQKAFLFLQELYSDSKTVQVMTSGSTGTPKIFEIEKERMLHSAKMTCDILNLKKGDSALICLPVEYISGKMMMVRAIERGLTLWVATPSSKPLTNLEEEIDFCAMSPLQVENSLDKIHWIKNLIIGGAAVSVSLKNKIFEALQNLQPSTVSLQPRIYETYGMSETLSHIALKQIYPITEDYFKVLDHVEISLDERQCLQIYAPQLNAEILKTNDLVELKNEREFRFLGRIDHVINSAGLKIYPEELENLLKKEISNEVIFVGIKDETFGQKLILAVEGEQSEILQAQLLNTIYPSKNHHPKETIYLEFFPRLPNGKLDRRALNTIVDHHLEK
jgi:O-succinylbenzoic acid--CoA ligase